MDIYPVYDPIELLKKYPYPGRAIMVGLSEDGREARAVYILTGRSKNSRNRRLRAEHGIVRTEPINPRRVTDPRLLVYTAMRKCKDGVIVANGDHSNTIFDRLKAGATFEEALDARVYEPDAPHYTPRIAAQLIFKDDYTYKMGILRAEIPEGETPSPDGPKAPYPCAHDYYEYFGLPGKGHFLCTYQKGEGVEGEPLPSFEGEPILVQMRYDAQTMIRRIWEALPLEYRIAIAVKTYDLESGKYATEIINQGPFSFL